MGTKVESDFKHIERNYFNYLGMGNDMISSGQVDDVRDQPLHLIESQLSGLNFTFDRIEKKMELLELRFGLLEERMVTMDYIDFKIEELNEWLEEEYSLLFDDLQFLKKAIIKYMEKDEI